MVEDRQKHVQITGALGVLLLFVSFAVYGWGWGGIDKTISYMVGVLSVVLATVWAAYDRI